MFLPESLRPTRREPVPRRKRRGLMKASLLCIAASTIVFLLSLWRIDRVEVTGCPALPEHFEELQGRWIPALRLTTVRRQVERWPGVAYAEVSLSLPGELHINAIAADDCGSFPVRTGWRAVACDGETGSRIEVPQPPLLVDFSPNRTELSRGLAVAERFAAGCRTTVERVRRITPVDYELQLSGGEDNGLRYIVAVRPDGSDAESWFFRAWHEGSAPVWSDLRLDDRVVIGGAA